MFDEHYLFAVADEAALVEVVRARYAEGPFMPATGDAPIVRRVEVMGDIVRETGSLSGGDAYLGHFLADRFGEPIVLQFPQATAAYVIAPGDDVAPARDREPSALPNWKPTFTLELALDLDKQRNLNRQLGTVEEQLPKLFPIQNRRKTARLDLKKLNVYSLHDHLYTAGKLRHENYVQMELQLALFEWSADGNDRTLVEMRSESVTFCTFKLLTTNGRFVRDGELYVQPADEYWFTFFRSMRRHAIGIRDDMSERMSWTDVSPTTLVAR